MALPDLPNEVLDHIAQNLDIRSLCKWREVNRPCNVIATRALFTYTAQWDEWEYGGPVSLALIAISNQLEVFRGMLDHTRAGFASGYNLKLARHPGLEKWSQSTFPYSSYSLIKNSTLLHVLCCLGRDEMARILLSKCTTGDSVSKDKSYPSDSTLLCDWEGLSPLHYAAKNDDVKTLRILLQYGADPSERSSSTNMSALEYAIVGGQYNVAELLLGEFATALHSDGPYYYTSLFTPAAQLGDIRFIDLILKNVKGGNEQIQAALNAALKALDSDEFVFSPLMAHHLIGLGAEMSTSLLNQVCWRENMEFLHLLLQRGAQFSLTTETGGPNTVIHYGSCSINMTRFILDQEPGFLNLPDPQGETPLDTVYGLRTWDKHGTDKLALFLIEADGQVTCSRALCRAAQAGHEPVVRALLRLDSQQPFISATIPEGKNALMYACKNRDPESHAIVNLLINARADIRAQDGPHSPTALYLATVAGAGPSVKSLLHAGARITDDSFENSYTYLARAIRSGSVETVQALLHYGTDPNSHNGAGYTALHLVIDVGLQTSWAKVFPQIVPSLLLCPDKPLEEFLPDEQHEREQIDFSYLGIVKALLNAGADVSAVDQAQYTALDHVLFRRLRGRVGFPPLQVSSDQVDMRAVGPTKRAQDAFWKCMESSQVAVKGGGKPIMEDDSDDDEPGLLLSGLGID